MTEAGNIGLKILGRPWIYLIFWNTAFPALNVSATVERPEFSPLLRLLGDLFCILVVYFDAGRFKNK
jgi:hypothetical protein